MSNEMKLSDWEKIYKLTIDGDCAVISKYKGKDSEVAVPSHVGEYRVTKIGKKAFAKNPLTTVILPETLEEIEESAFEDCANLSEIRWTKGLRVIGKRAFYNCYALTVIRLPETVAELGVNAFAAKANFTSEPLMHLSAVYMPAEIKVFKGFLGEFYDYGVEVYFPGKKTKITAKDFFGAEARLHVPAGSKTEEYAQKVNVPVVAE